MMIFSALGKYGRLGNQMFQVASTIGIARKYGRDFAFPKWINHDQLNRFSIEDNYNIGDALLRPLPLWDGTPYPEHFIHWGYSDLFVPDNVDLTGHMQSEKYFKHCEDEIRYYLKFWQQLQYSPPFTALHVRMGDYGSDYHPICPPEYYYNAVKITGSQKIMLFSDEPDRAVAYLPEIQFHTINRGNTLDAMYNMISCRKHIIANSTFSWWGAWLSHKPECVVAPKQWFGPAASHLETRDIYPESWIVI